MKQANKLDSQIIKIEHRVLGNILPGFMYLSKVVDLILYS